MPPKALLPNPCSNIEWRLRTQSEFLQSLNPCFNGRYSLRSYHWTYATPGIGPRHNANRYTVFRLFDTKIQKSFYFLIKKQKKQFDQWLKMQENTVQENTVRENHILYRSWLEFLPFACRLPSAPFSSLLFSSLSSEVFPFWCFFSVWSWLVKSEKNVACRKYIYITTAQGSVSRA